MPFEFEKTQIEDVVLVKPSVFGDDRGYFMETYKKSDWEVNGLPTDFTQDNQSFSSAGVLRGLHYQLDPHAQGKLVRVATGSIFDVAVDIRQGSPTYGRWVGKTLTAENKHMLWVPQGFAHGVLVLEDNTTLLYKCVGEYHPDSERSLLWNDPAIGIEWPDVGEVLLLDKDRAGAHLSDAENNYIY